MAVTSLHGEKIASRPDLNLLEEACCDLDRARILATATERALANVRDWLRMLPNAEHIVAELNDADTLLSETASKAALAARAVEEYSSAERGSRQAAKL